MLRVSRFTKPYIADNSVPGTVTYFCVSQKFEDFTQHSGHQTGREEKVEVVLYKKTLKDTKMNRTCGGLRKWLEGLASSHTATACGRAYACCG